MSEETLDTKVTVLHKYVFGNGIRGLGARVDALEEKEPLKVEDNECHERMKSLVAKEEKCRSEVDKKIASSVEKLEEMFEKLKKNNTAFNIVQTAVFVITSLLVVWKLIGGTP